MKDTLPVFLKENFSDANALFISGDFRLASASVSNDAADAVEYIKRLVTSLGISTDDVFCVPGNHDLNRDPLRNVILNGLRDIEKSPYSPDKGYFEKEILQPLIDGFSYFAEIEELLYGKKILTSNLEIHKTLVKDKCNILLLNTAFTAGNDDDRHKLYLGSKYLRDALSKLDTNKPTIMMGHHGHSFLNREDVKYAQKILKENHVAIYLCGHEHDLVDETVFDGAYQYTAGCILSKESSDSARASFYVMTLDAQNNVNVEGFAWTKKQWYTTPVNNKTVTLPTAAKAGTGSKGKKAHQAANTSHTNDAIATIKPKYARIPMRKYDFALLGHKLLGVTGKEGIKYFWGIKGKRDIVESVTFNKRLLLDDHSPEKTKENEEISAYTSSVSFGCALVASEDQCNFCGTGANRFRGFLTAEEIALQNIFMAAYDTNCTSFPEVRTNKREFAFMGQGEPGFSYAQIRRAILLTDCAMKAMGQTIHRYIISTSGVADFMYPLIDDIKAGIYENKISLHFSLHCIAEERKHMMPIERKFKYSEFLELCKKFYKVSADAFRVEDKIGVGIMMFKNFQLNINGASRKITLDKNKLDKILSELDSDVFRIDLCWMNPVQSIDVELNNEEATNLLAHTRGKGFEAKKFASFGTGDSAGCGQLRSDRSSIKMIGENTKVMFDNALQLLHYAINELEQ